MDNKIKILVLSDHPLSPSGVGTQTKNMIDAMIQTGKYRFVCLGGAIKHEDYRPVKTEEWGEDCIIFPIDGYGNPDMIRSVLRNERPDILWFMTDPRFWGWLWQMEDEIRSLVPTVYYHVWDNHPPPTYNKPYYESTDVIACISKVTNDIVEKVIPEHEERYYLPHAVNTNIFSKISKEDILSARSQHFPNSENKTIFFYNSRNARRKQTGSLLFWFKTFLNKVGSDKAILCLHTDPKDPHGQDLDAIAKYLEFDEGEIIISKKKVPPEYLSLMYNMADCTINISDAEGFGLSALESLSCETPLIATMTGGLQEQITNGESWFGIGLEPTSRAIIGSQEIPWIYEDRLSEEDVVKAMEEIYNMDSDEREIMGAMGRQHVLQNYSMEKFIKQWDELLSHTVEKFGSWENRKNYKGWELKEIV